MMNKQPVIWRFIHKNLLIQVPVMLLYVTESEGSSPGRKGFHMAVNLSGEMEGSIGGGIMEHKFVELAREKLRSGKPETSLFRQFHDKRAVKDQSGMICSGQQTILLHRVTATDIPAIERLVGSLENFRNGRLILSPEGISFIDPPGASPEIFRFDEENKWRYEEITGLKDHLHIIGGGHCALALSKLMSGMDFFLHLYENRPDLNTFLQNEFVHEKRIVGHYNELAQLVTGGERQYAVIMTFGYRTDDEALRALAGREFKYLGMLGSASKIKEMFRMYQEEGMDAQWIGSIHAPAGIQIKSQTPEEIAVSIAAEIIRIKNL
jgi:xanthine dehydrogenase accessory factor